MTDRKMTVIAGGKDAADASKKRRGSGGGGEKLGADWRDGLV